MNSVRRLLAATMLLIVSCPAFSESPSRDWEQQPWNCGQPANVPAALLAAALEAKDYYVLPTTSKKVLLLNLPSPAYGAVLIREAGVKWRTTALAEGSEIVGVYYSDVLRRFLIAASWVREGPSGQLSTLSGRLQPWSLSCGVVELGKDRWLTDVQFNAERTGNGLLLGTLQSSTTDETGTWLEYATPDFGKKWGKPRHSDKPPTNQGEFQPITKGSDSENARNAERYFRQRSQAQ
jgi:hypothetical protein